MNRDSALRVLRFGFVLSLLTSACGARADSSPAAAAPSVSAGATLRAPSEFDLVYWTPASDPKLDGTVAQRVISASGSFGPEHALGAHRAFRAISSGPGSTGPFDLVALQDGTGAVRVVALSSTRTVTLVTTSAVALPAAISLSTSFALGDGGHVFIFDGAGHQSGSFTVPMPTTGPLLVDGNLTKVNIGPQSGSVAAVLVTADDHVLAFVQNSVNSLLVDLSAGRSLDLPNYGFVNDALIGSDGRIYAVVRDVSRRAASFELAIFDPSDLHLIRSIPSGWSPADGAVDDIHLVALRGGSIYLYASQVLNSDPSNHASRLARLDANSATLSAIALPANLGVRVTAGPDDLLYLYGGIAGSQITQLDPAHGSARVLTGISSPAGSYIAALFAR